tara:strand:+ start:655 stop:945 length:291 start_codon:yes stop_codon:yes gene_type:complete
MRTREKQNKHKLKFQYIAHLKMLGKIWKEHCVLIKSRNSIVDDNYNNEVVKLMNSAVKKEFCFILDRCNDFSANISKIDKSLSDSHENFRKYKKLF